MALDRRGEILVIEIKSSVADFRADRKWQDYLEFCDRFAFAVGRAFPRELLPPEVGLMVADAYDAHVLRGSPTTKLPAARRKPSDATLRPCRERTPATARRPEL